MNKNKKRLIHIVAIFLSPAPILFAYFHQEEKASDEVSSPKYDVLMGMNIKVSMRDGINLATDIYRPNKQGKFPVVLAWTPYGSESPRFSDQGKYFAKRGYVYAV